MAAWSLAPWSSMRAPPHATAPAMRNERAPKRARQDFIVGDPFDDDGVVQPMYLSCFDAERGDCSEETPTSRGHLDQIER
jgi:hypothetical protein